MNKISTEDKLEFTYKNWRGEVGTRKAEVVGFTYDSNEYHAEPQWLMIAMDLDKGELRTFAMDDMSEVKKIREE